MFKAFLKGALTNIQTSVLGTVVGGGLFEGLGGLHTPDGKLNWIAILTGAGMVLKGMVAKDARVSGGTVQQ